MSNVGAINFHLLANWYFNPFSLNCVGILERKSGTESAALNRPYRCKISSNGKACHGKRLTAKKDTLSNALYEITTSL